jgi:HEAT repeat protein
MTLFMTVQTVVALVSVVFCIGGGMASHQRRRREARRLQAHHWAATIILDGGPDLEEASRDLAEIPISLLAEVLQQLSSDTTGEARRRLRVVARHAGLTRRIERLSRNRSWRRRVQAAHLLMLLPSGSPERFSLLSDANPFVRARAIESMSPAGVDEFASLLLDALSDPSPAVRSAAQHALTGGSGECVPSIIEALDRSLRGELDTETTVLIVEIATELPDTRLAAPLLRLAGHDDARLRMLVAASLGGGIFPDPVEQLAMLLGDAEPDVRAEAAKSVGAGGFVALAPQVGRLLADHHWQVRREAGSALALMGPVGRVILRCHLTDADAFARDMAIHILDQMSGMADRPIASNRWVAA